MNKKKDLEQFPFKSKPSVRKNLYPGEMEYFRSNPNVSGMAAEDDMVILNPFSPLDEDSQSAVILNERARILMRRGKRPIFALTPEQRRSFEGYSDDEQDVRETIAARLLSGDPSAGKPTPEQLRYIELLREVMNGLPD
jgi:hypothetical protein